MYAVRFMYPANPSLKESLTPEQRVARDLALAQRNKPGNVDYWFCGDSSIKPVAASDDGVHTRLTFAAKAELPAIFVNNDDGSESLLNFNMDEGDVVIHRVAPRFIVRRGRLTGCIVNKHFVGGGERLRFRHHRTRSDPRTQGVRAMSAGKYRAGRPGILRLGVERRGNDGDADRSRQTAICAGAGPPESPNEFRVARRRAGKSALHRARSLQSRASHVLALSLMGALAVGLLGWYYFHTFAARGTAHRTAQSASRNQAAGDAPLPSLGPITLPEVPVEKILGPAPEEPPISHEPSPTLAGSLAHGVPPQPIPKSPAEIALDRRLTGPRFLDAATAMPRRVRRRQVLARV